MLVIDSHAHPPRKGVPGIDNRPRTIPKSLEQIDKIFIEELSEFLQYILTEYPKLLSTEGKQSDRTNLKRLIRIYDWIKYYK